MTTRELKLFGQPAILGPDGATPVRLKRCALLLAMLASTPDGMERATLAERLWEEGEEAARLRRLRRLVFEARGLLGEDALPEQSGRLALSDAWRAHCDVARYLQQYHSLIHHGGNVSAPVPAFDIVQAARAPLLGDWAFDERTQAAEWLDFQRTAQSSRCRRMRDKIVASLLAQGAHDDALRMMLADIERDRIDEAGWEQAAIMLFNAGRDEECIARYRTLRGNLFEALGVEVSASFTRLARNAEARLALRNVWGQSRPRTSYTDAGGVYLAWQCFGAGKTDLLIIPGFVSNVEMAWEQPELATFLARAAREFRVIMFDRRGVGLSDRTLEDPSMSTAVSDVLAVLDAADSKSAVVFGASEGGPVAIQLCCAHPQRVRALCLYAALPKGTASASYGSALTSQQYDLWRERLVADWGTGRSIAAFAPSHANDPTLNDWWARLLRLSSSPGTIAGILDQLRNIDVTALLPCVRCPTVLMHRRGDRAVRIEASRFMAASIPGASLVDLEGADHWWWLDDVDVLLGRLLALRDGVESLENGK
ncbi:alpha/beta fold hydrolase [Massilia pinisoli]|uniref:Alpha/beta fold hydrolase n=1 Tax=Massilia pinisoli TaxID=1772194 RepID=A0ABT1ZVB0_9BURK|nr:alpha/beta hydrolase [Massilia pinisoli]MCS0583564.1 alpha/beta fold hydrolase [Massilia pinisoli]